MERMFFFGLSENLVTQHKMVENHSRSKGVMKYMYLIHSYPILFSSDFSLLMVWG